MMALLVLSLLEVDDSSSVGELADVLLVPVPLEIVHEHIFWRHLLDLQFEDVILLLKAVAGLMWSYLDGYLM